MNDSLPSRGFILKQVRFDYEPSIYNLSQMHAVLIKLSSNYSVTEKNFFCRYISLFLAVNFACWQNKSSILLVLIIQGCLDKFLSVFSKDFKTITLAQKLIYRSLSQLAFNQKLFLSKNLYGDKDLFLKLDFTQSNGSKS